MKRGTWHQCGSKNQVLVEEQLGNECGAGVVLSQRDLKFEAARVYARKYRELGAEVVCDPQAYFHDFRNEELRSYPIDALRRSLSSQRRLSPQDLRDVREGLLHINRELRATAVIAPAVTYEAGQPEIAELNAKLLTEAKRAGDDLGVPTYATAIVGRSATQSKKTLREALDQITALQPQGWYFGFEFGEERIPTSAEHVERCGEAGLALAMTDLPVLHAFAGPMALLSFAFGAKAAAIGHSQSLWRFNRARGQAKTKKGGGGGSSPPRYFSEALWDTIIYPDETRQLPAEVLARVLTKSSFSASPLKNLPWNSWDARKHLVAVIGSMTKRIAETETPSASATAALHVLETAIQVRREIFQQHHVMLSGGEHLEPWRAALKALRANRAVDYEALGEE